MKKIESRSNDEAVKKMTEKLDVENILICFDADLSLINF